MGMTLTAIDLFGGAGGMTVGLKAAGFRVLATVDSSPLAVRTYGANHGDVRAWLSDIRRLDPLLVARELDLRQGELDLLAGCPPCQGFSTIRTRRRTSSVPDRRNQLVAQFARWTEALRPRSVMLENVPGLAEDARLRRLTRRLRRLGYSLTEDVLDAADYGVPQRRRRFVLLGALEGAVAFAPASTAVATVRAAIGSLVRPHESDDPLHNHGEQRTAAVRRRIESIPAEGGLRQLGTEHQLPCHRRLSGFYDIYGRMRWDEPAPTLTGGCINPSKGRFLHPEQHRAITLREAALLQAFPPTYRLPLDGGKYRAADLIGNALPPRFVQAHAERLAASLTGGPGPPRKAR